MWKRIRPSISLVSEVEGKLVNGIGIGRIIKNIFPPGSVTGAPKRRVLQVIDEPGAPLQGAYCGAVGVFFPDGDFTLSVGIRLLITDPGRQRSGWGEGSYGILTRRGNMRKRC